MRTVLPISSLQTCTGVMNEKARIQEDFYITDSVHISQEDINQLIIAKAGLRTDQELLMKYYGITVTDVEKIYLAGAIDMLINREKRRDAERVLSRIHHTKPNEIEGDQFQYEVAENIYFV